MTTPVTRASQSQSSQAAALSNARDAQFTFQQLWPAIDRYARQYGADPHVLAAIVMQESSFKNWGVHRDGTGHGLIGLDDHGLLPDFERWSGQSYGRGASARSIPPEKQLEYLAKTIAASTQRYGSAFAAARAWHRGGGAMNDSLGYHYEALIRAHINTLFPGGKNPTGAQPSPAPAPSPAHPAPAPAPSAPGSSSYTIKSGDTLWGIASRLRAQGVPGSVWDIIRSIQRLNPKITNPNLIYAGDTLHLPGAGGSYTPPSKPPVQVNPPAPVNPKPPSAGPGNVPYINQYRPVGAERGYWNGPANCGPTSMAMIARAFGYGKGLTDAQLINQLGRIGGTSGNGTNVNGIALMARAMGKSAQTRGPGPDVGWIADQLRHGKLVVANGDYWAMPPHQNEARTSGHYVCVCGLDAHGNFIVRDPADQHVSTITPSQLNHFLRANPNGGYAIAVG